MGTKMRKVGFTFNEASLKSLDDMWARSGLPDRAAVVKQSLQILQALQTQEAQGYTQVSVRNPETGEERFYNGSSLDHFLRN
ncbi:hypothetical protein HOA55_02670 [archaeon]|jgi:hypothetical protein|nr:hypothetical protein [archaeon]MBT3577223.1 hypothetical protein [archaeon]MBT6820232.1 hypothetical protein [archaeon]MBT6956737.1 hypothetical protein [archaeon]MBT7025436.1 hypothetical protein [archaeon]